MLRVVETFSGIGSQAKALKNINAEYKVLNTVEWDLNALYAYDIIHNGPQDLTPYQEIDKKTLLQLMMGYNVSLNGKEKVSYIALRSMTTDALRRFLCAIRRTNNLVDITEVCVTDLPKRIDLLTYSFPCQDLSVCGSWHNNMSGINRDVENRSGLLWEIERILSEYKNDGRQLPKFLLMENVSNILSKRHNGNFGEWKDFLTNLGYYNQVYTLNALNFGIPQSRCRTYMLSVLCPLKQRRQRVVTYFTSNNLENIPPQKFAELQSFLRMDYTSNTSYQKEADMSNPFFTPSRKKIYEDNELIFDGTDYMKGYVGTVTTKQDRNPNAGLIAYSSSSPGKAPYRNLTPRECFLLMGFDESDYQILQDNDFEVKTGKPLYSREKMIKMAGNSIVVNVLEAIFRQVVDLKEMLWPSSGQGSRNRKG